MTESETVTIEVPTEETPEVTVDASELAEAIVEAEVDAAHEIQQEAEVEHAEELAESALESVATHEHGEYALVGHGHIELEDRISNIEAQLVSLSSEIEETETDEIEIVEPVDESPPPPEIRKHGLRRGRS